MFGSAIGKVFEWFYERRFWAEKDPLMACLNSVDEAIQWVCEDKKFDRLSDPAFTNILRQELHQYIPHGLEIIREHGFLTTNSSAEVDLTVLYDSPKHGMRLKMGGRADFIHGADKLHIDILDGKGSRHREKYVDSDQLIWYAVQFYLKYHVAPTRLGFVFWKFPKEPVKWIAYDNDAMRNLVDDTFEVAKKIKLQVFNAVPEGHCYQCDYRDKCEDGKKFLAGKKAESRIINSIFDLENI